MRRRWSRIRRSSMSSSRWQAHHAVFNHEYRARDRTVLGWHRHRSEAFLAHRRVFRSLTWHRGGDAWSGSVRAVTGAVSAGVFEPPKGDAMCRHHLRSASHGGLSEGGQAGVSEEGVAGRGGPEKRGCRREAFGRSELQPALMDGRSTRQGVLCPRCGPDPDRRGDVDARRHGEAAECDGPWNDAKAQGDGVEDGPSFSAATKNRAVPLTFTGTLTDWLSPSSCSGFVAKGGGRVEADPQVGPGLGVDFVKRRC